MKSRINKITIAGISLLIGTFLSPLFYCGQKNPLFLTAKSNTQVSDAKKIAISLEDAFQEVFSDVSPSVVSVATERTVDVAVDPLFEYFYGRRPGGIQKQKQSGLGSGVILNKDGYILTNEHVVKGWDTFVIKFKNKKTVEAKLIGTTSRFDLALLKVPADNDLKPAVLGNSDDVRVGNWAIALGAPLGLEQSFTVGVVSAVGRVGIDASGMSYIQSDAAINQGNSGGPLLNIRGEVIGINRMIASRSGGSDGIGFSIPINQAKLILDDLKTGKKIKGPPWLGIGIDELNDNYKKELQLDNTSGAVILEIHGGSPADKAHLKVMDVITHIDGKKINGPKDVIEIVRSSKTGQRLSLQLIREGNKITTTIVPEQSPN